MVYILAVVAALIVGVGTVVEQHAASQAPPEYNLSPKLLVHLAQRPLWLSGVACSLAGNLVFAAALGFGSVALVTAVFVLRLLFALAIAAGWRRHRVPVRDLLGSLAVVGGLAGFILAGQPREGTGGGLALLTWALGGGSVIAFAMVLVAIAKRSGPVRKAVLLGAGGGALFGLQASLTHTAVGVITGPGIVALLMSWPGYTVAAVAILGALIVQSAYEAAPLPASYPAIVTTELLCGIALGVWLLGGSIRLDGVGLAIAAPGVGVMIVGIYLLTTSPLITGQVDQLIRQQEIGRARQLESRLERELRWTDRAVRRGESRLGSSPDGGALPRPLQREVNRIEDRLGHLARLQGEIGRDRALYAHERALDERARQLRDRAARVGARLPEHSTTDGKERTAEQEPG